MTFRNGTLFVAVKYIIHSCIRCEDLAEIIWLNRQQIRQLEMIHEGLNIPSQETSMNILPELADGLNVLLDSLVKSSFVIEKQPPQVLKTNTRFSATIRLLVGTKLNVHMSPPVTGNTVHSMIFSNSICFKRIGFSGSNSSHYIRVPSKLPVAGRPLAHKKDQVMV